MIEAPLISVIIPYFNTGKMLDEAIASVRRQAYARIEIIIVDDGSSDDIAQRVKTLGTDIIFLRQENKGPAAARNLGIRHASGRIIAFLDSDDLWPDGKLALQMARMQQDPGLGIVTGRIRYVTLEGGKGIPVAFQEKTERVYVHLGAALVRRWVFDDIGFLNEDLIFHEDLDWSMRIREYKIPMALIPQTTLIVRRHSSNMTRYISQKDAGLLKVLKQSVERRKCLHGQACDLPPLPGYDVE